MRKELRGYVEAFRSSAPVQPQHVTEDEVKRAEVLRKIHAWITAWSEMARTVITRRDQMIKLGIAKRRAHKARGGGVAPAAPPVTPPPPAVVGEHAPAVPPAPPSGVVAVSDGDDETGPASHLW